MSQSVALIPAQFIQVVEHATDWMTAVQRASEPLLQSGWITQDYIQQIQDSVQTHGPYMVLQDYFALMHARPSQAVNRAGMSLLVSKEPVDLAGKPVKIFLVLAATDHNSHLASLQAVMQVLMDQQHYQALLEGNYDDIVTMFK